MPAFSGFIVDESAPIPLNLKEVKMAIGYPEEARGKDIQGDLAVKILINEKGMYVEHTFVRRGSPIFEQAIAREIPQLKFKPVQENGKAVSSWVTIPFKFRLDKDKNPIDPEEDDC